MGLLSTLEPFHVIKPYFKVCWDTSEANSSSGFGWGVGGDVLEAACFLSVRLHIREGRGYGAWI